jgi:uncharacterized protein YbjT (DUF2867 family)
MDIAIIGGTGTLGGAVVAELTRRGHTVRAISRSAPGHPVDLTTGAGLDAALAGADVVVNAVNGEPSKKGRGVLVDGTRRLLDAEAQAGVAHHVEIGIVGSDRIPMDYYDLKIEQEQLVEAGPVPWTIVRATQFHEFVAWIFDSAAGKRMLPGGHVPIQPIAVAEVAPAVADVAEGDPLRRTINVAGPRVEDLGVLAAAWKGATGKRAVRVPVPGATKMLRALREGHLTTETPDIRGTTTFATWLQTSA